MYESYPITTSSFITDLSYDPDTTLMTVTMGDRSYEYHNVDLDEFEDFMKAHSKGKFYNYNIKGVVGKVIKDYMKQKKDVIASKSSNPFFK